MITEPEQTVGEWHGRAALRSLVRVTLGWVGGGLLFALFILAMHPQDLRVLTWLAPWLGAAAVALVAALGVLRLGAVYARVTPSLAAAVGALHAFVALLVGVIAGSCPGLFSNLRELETWGMQSWLFDWLVKPVYWVMLVGAIPATLLGAGCGLHVRHWLHRHQA